MGVVVEREDHARHAALKISFNVPLKLPLYVLLPAHHALYGGRHEPDLAVTEHSVGVKGRAWHEGLRDLLLEASDPRRVYGHCRKA